MAASIGGGARKGGRGRRGVPRYGAMADINMTPFIDVMLVLLIIFMVAAPLLTSGVAVDLPKTSAGALNVDKKPIAVAINEQGAIFLNEAPVQIGDLTKGIGDLAGGDFDQRIYVRADKKVAYGQVADVMSAVTAAGYKKVALVTEPDRR